MREKLTMKATQKIVSVFTDDSVQRELVRVLPTYEFAFSESATQGLELVENLGPDLVLLGLSVAFPSRTLELCSQLRHSSPVPVIVLGPNEERFLVGALYQGADDYLVLPFSERELTARVYARLRRPMLDEESSLGGERLTKELDSEDGYLRLYPDQHRVWAGGQEVSLTSTEFELLLLLMEQPEKVLTHSWLLHRVWGPEYGTEVDYVRVFVRQIRRKIEPDPARPRYICTVSGSGYVFRAKSREPVVPSDERERCPEEENRIQTASQTS